LVEYHKQISKYLEYKKIDNMTNKGKIITLSIIAIASYTAFFIYQRYQRKKANERVVSYEEALKMLSEAEGQ
jgi:predicted negative regulator of RcsB-dependent stress response